MLNISDNNICEGCGAVLLKGKDYDKKFRELKDYEKYKVKYNLIEIILGILALIILYPLINLFFSFLFSSSGLTPIPEPFQKYILKYGALLLTSIVLTVLLIPKISGYIKTRLKYRWTRKDIKILDSKLKFINEKYTDNNFQTEVTSSSSKKTSVIPITLFIIMLVAAVIIYANKYTDFKPLDYFISMFHTEPAVKISGCYECHYEEKDLNGVVQAEQTWNLCFYSNGHDISYLDNDQQFSGKWSQKGSILTMHIDPIPNLSTELSTVTAKISTDGEKIIWGERTYIKVNDYMNE